MSHTNVSSISYTLAMLLISKEGFGWNASRGINLSPSLRYGSTTFDIFLSVKRAKGVRFFLVGVMIPNDVHKSFFTETSAEPRASDYSYPLKRKKTSIVTTAMIFDDGCMDTFTSEETWSGKVPHCILRRMIYFFKSRRTSFFCSYM